MLFRKPVWLVLVFLISIPAVYAQNAPAENAVLNYRLIPFLFQGDSPRERCNLEIASGTYNDLASFKKHLVKTYKSVSAGCVGMVPYFGTEYTWVAQNPASKKPPIFHHFSVGTIAALDTAHSRVRINLPARKYKDAYFFVDGSRLMYDMSGSPVWYMPDIPGTDTSTYMHLRDMKVSPQGTLTFLLLTEALEVNYDGRVLWRTPRGKPTVSGDSLEHVHHEFTRLRNGNYMVMGKQYVPWKLPEGTDTARFAASNLRWDSSCHCPVQILEFGTLLEYDSSGHIVWSWSSKDFLMKNKPRPGLQRKMELVDAHSNSFYFQEADSSIYVGFRNISSVLRVHYPDGAVTAMYKNTPGGAGNVMTNALFCFQHACRLTAAGRISMFNNNLCRIGSAPTIAVFDQPKDGGNQLKKAWEFECPVPNDPSKPPMQFVAGGNAVEMPDSSFFVSMYGDNYASVFLVSPDKKIIWMATPENRDPKTGLWFGTDFYRASVVTDPKVIKRFVQSGENATR